MSDWPFEARGRYRVVLPQRHRATLEGALVAPGAMGALFAVRDFRAVGAPEQGRAPSFEPIHRLCYMSRPTSPLVDALALSGRQLMRALPEEPSSTVLTVQLTGSFEDAYLLVGPLLFRLLERGSSLELAAALRFGEQTPVSEVLAASPFGHGILAVSEDDDGLCHLLSANQTGLVDVNLGVVGSSRASLAVHEDHAVVSSLFEVWRVAADGAVDGPQDLRSGFMGQGFAGMELLALAPDGTIWLSDGRLMARVRPGGAAEMFLPPHPVHSMACVERDLVCVSADPASATATIHLYGQGSH